MSHLQLSLIIVIKVLLLSACGGSESGDSHSEESASIGPSTVAISVEGQLDASKLESSITGEDGVQLAERDVVITDEKGFEVAKSKTNSDGEFRIMAPGTLSVESKEENLGQGSSDEEVSDTKEVLAEKSEELENNPDSDLFLSQTTTQYKIRTILPDTADGTVVGIDNIIDLSKGNVKLGKTPLKKITAIRGRILLEGAKDHTGIVVFVPGTSFSARTDSAGIFLMTFIQEGDYQLRIEKDGYTPLDIQGVTVVEGETTQIGKRTLKLSGGVSTFSVEQLGVRGKSQTRTVTFRIQSGDSDRFKGGLATDLETTPFDAVPSEFTYEFQSDGVFDLKMIFANADGFETTVSRLIEVDTVLPEVNGIQLADRSSLNTAYTNERFVIPYHPTCDDVDKVAIFIDSEAVPTVNDFVYDCQTSSVTDTIVFALKPGVDRISYNIWAMDSVGNISKSSNSGLIRFDETPPQAPRIYLADQTSGSSLGSDITTVDVMIDSCEDIKYFLISESQLVPPQNGDFHLECTIEPGAYQFTFGNNIEGTKTVLAWAVDHAGNVGQVSKTFTYTLDYTKPNSPGFSIADPSPAVAGYSNDSRLVVTPEHCTDTTHIHISETQTTPPNENDAAWVACDTNGVFTDITSQGNLTFHLWSRDIGGNVSESSQTQSIIVDTSIPVAPSFDIVDSSNSNTSYTNALTVNLAISDCSDANKVFVSESPDAPSFSDFVDSCSVSSNTFTLGNNSEEIKTLYLWTRDLAGNISAAASTSSIAYDITPPSAPSSFSVSDPSSSSTTYSNETTLDFTIDSCNGDGNKVLLREDQNTAPLESDGGWFDCVTSGSVASLISSSQASHNVYLWLKDQAGNISSGSVASIIFDTVQPASISLDSYPSHTPSSSLTFTGSAEGYATVNLQKYNASSLQYETIASSDLSASGAYSQAVTLDDNSLNQYRFAVIDRAGNTSSYVYASIYHDTNDPSISNVRTLITDTTITVYWDTNETTNTYLVWGASASYGTVLSDASTGTSHSLTIEGLTEGTLYYFKIVATDLAGNNDASNDYEGSDTTYLGKTGSISADETWSNTSIPYYVSSSAFTVDSGAVLTIQPGVTIKMSADSEIRVNGKIVAQGTSGSPITFTSNQLTPTKGFWGAVILELGSDSLSLDGSSNYVDGHVFQYVTFEYGDYGLHTKQATSSLVENCTFQQNLYGIYQSSYGGPHYVRESSFQNNDRGIYLTGGGTSTWDIVDSSFADNTYPLYFNGLTHSTNLDILRNSFQNYTYGIYYTVSSWYAPSSISIQYNEFLGGGAATYGIRFNGGMASISKNILIGHTTAIHHAVKSNDPETVYLDNNVLAYNDYAFSVPGHDRTDPVTQYFRNNIVYKNGGTSLNNVIFYTSGTDNSSLKDTLNHYYQNNLFQENYSSLTGAMGIRLCNSYCNHSFTNNTWVDNSFDYLMRTYKPYTSSDFDVTNAYWGTTDEATIDSLLYDGGEDADYNDFIITGFLSAPPDSTPISVPTSLSLTDNEDGSISLTWDENLEADVAGYRVYYTQSSGYPYDGSGLSVSSGADLGDVQSTTISGLSTGTYYFSVVAYDGSTDGTDDLFDGNQSWFADEVSVVIP